jgi:hypothetical protein
MLDFTTNFLEVRPLLKPAGCSKAVVKRFPSRTLQRLSRNDGGYISKAAWKTDTSFKKCQP